MFFETYDKEYKSTLTRIGGSMLLFLLLFDLLIPLGMDISQIFENYLDAKSVYIIDSIIGSVAYMLSFSIPAIFFYIISPKRSCRAVWTEARMDRRAPLMLVGVIAVSLAMSHINYYILDLLDYYSYYDMYMQNDVLDENYKLILAIISTALVPALCEEYLFRGVILTNLLPYGKTSAVFISAILFGFMHQNPGQMLYTTVAGVALGLVYIKTKSMWCGVLIHFFNNLYSVFNQLLADRLPEATADKICSIVEAAVFVVGFVCIIALILIDRHSKRDFSNGSFETVGEQCEEYIEKPISKGGIRTMFTSPTMIIFICISCAEMILRMLVSWGVIRL